MDEVHAKHKSHMACPSFFIGEAMGISFFSNSFLFWRKVLSFENFGDFENTFNLFI
jgi:hypothetical protein